MTSQSTTSNLAAGCRLWIDGVGCWSLWMGDSLTLGGAADVRSSEADFAIQAPLSRKHALLLATEEDCQLIPIGPVKLNGKLLEQKTFLPRQAELQLGDEVRLQYAIPNELSYSSRITCLGNHRPVDRTDGLIMVRSQLMLGPGAGMHIPCPNWPGMVVLFRRQGGLWCQSKPELMLNGSPLHEPQPLQHGSVITGSGLRMRIEDTSWKDV